MRQMRKWALSAVPVFLLSVSLFAQESSSDIKAFLEELQKNQQEMRLELQEIKSLLSRLPQQKPSTAQQPINIKDVEFEIGDNPIVGNGSAKLILVEFTDYQCSFCSRYVKDTFPQLLKEYITV